MICLLSSFQVIFLFWLSFLEALKHVRNVSHMSIPAASWIKTSVIGSTHVQYCWAERDTQLPSVGLVATSGNRCRRVTHPVAEMPDSKFSHLPHCSGIVSEIHPGENCQHKDICVAASHFQSTVRLVFCSIRYTVAPFWSETLPRVKNGIFFLRSIFQEIHQVHIKGRSSGIFSLL